MNNKSIKVIQELVEIHARMERTGNDSFLEVAGHVQKVSYRCYKGKWKEGKEPDINVSFYYSGPLHERYIVAREMDKIRAFAKQF